MNRIPSRDFLNALLMVLIFALAIGIITFWRNSGTEKTVYLEVELGGESSGVSQVFFDTGEGFSEQGSQRQTVYATGDSQVVRFLFPPHPVNAVRFDPINNRGPISISSTRIVANNGAELASIPLDNWRVGGDSAQMSREPNALNLMVPDSSAISDPQLVLDAEYPLRYDYGNEVYIGNSVITGLLSGLALLGLFVVVRLNSRRTVVQTLFHSPAWLRRNLYLVNRPPNEREM